MARMFVAEVVTSINEKNDKLKDKTESGRVKIRIYGRHDDEQNIKDEDLPFARTLMPPDSASTAGIGKPPIGLVKGSRVIVTFLEDDKEEQYPIILGSFPRGGKGPEGA